MAWQLGEPEFSLGNRRQHTVDMEGLFFVFFFSSYSPPGLSDKIILADHQTNDQPTNREEFHQFLLLFSIFFLLLLKV